MRSVRIPKHAVNVYWLLLFLCTGLILAGCTRQDILTAYLQENRAGLQRPASDDETVVQFEVQPGTPARTIGEQLAQAGLIEDAQLFEAYVRAEGLANRLEAGTFQLQASMTPVEIVDTLLNSRSQGITVTIPEGWRLEQIADFLSKSGLVSGDAYRVRAGSGSLAGLDAERWPFLAVKPAGASLEGFLFPDTYQLPAEQPTADDLIGRQLDTFGQRLVPIYEQALADGQDVPDLYAALILASIVEREAVVPDERPSIAGVYLNRLAAGMKLDADPTVQYAMGYQEDRDQWWKTPIFLEEYQAVDSPYNTYIYQGIPPGPIANPGVASFRAVLYPAEHDYLYFVATPDGSGAHVFAQTYAEHVENVRLYRGR